MSNLENPANPQPQQPASAAYTANQQAFPPAQDRPGQAPRDHGHARVLVVGSGIAGTVAAVQAAKTLGESGSVHLVSNGALFSGSSFFEGTWGLGLIAPVDEADEQDLAHTIVGVGCGAADPDLVRSFVSGIRPAMQQLLDWGCTLLEPSAQAADQRDYIPCFDHKHRTWRGIQRQPFVDAVGAQLSQHSVRVHQRWELLELTPPASGQAGSALFFDHCLQDFTCMSFDAVVLCTGGTSSLFPRRLTKADCLATVHAIAANAGCSTTNLEFLQFMPGLVQPVRGVVFNEKTFRYMQFPANTVQELGGSERASALLDQRSGHGPFTCRLDSRLVDLALCAQAADGLELTPRLQQDLPEFARTYFDWLHDSMGVAAQDPLRIAHYAHASNGGIRIDQQGFTGVDGVYAAGECTGGMHGADRIGGLSSANGLVFGLRAGAAAARYANAAKPSAAHPNTAECAGAAHGNASMAGGGTLTDRSGALTPHGSNPGEDELPAWTGAFCPCAEQTEAHMQQLMDQHCGVVRTGDGLTSALEQVAQLLQSLNDQLRPGATPAQAALTQRTRLRLQTAAMMLSAALQRTESAGSHYRADAEGLCPTAQRPDAKREQARCRGRE